MSLYTHAGAATTASSADTNTTEEPSLLAVSDSCHTFYTFVIIYTQTPPVSNFACV